MVVVLGNTHCASSARATLSTTIGWLRQTGLEGKISAFEGYEDSAAVVAAFTAKPH